MSPVPKTKANDILEKLSCYHDRKKSNSFLLNRDRREAEKLIPKDPVGAYSILGAVACLEDNLQLMHRYHKLSIENSHHSYPAVFNYIASLEKCCLWEDSYNFILSESMNDKANIELLFHSIESAERIGFYSKAVGLIQQYNKLNIIEAYPETVLDNKIKEILDIQKISDTDFAKIINIVSFVLASKGLIVSSYKTGVVKPETLDEAYIHKEFILHEEIDYDLHEIEDEIESKIVNEIPLHVREAISISIYHPSIADFIGVMNNKVAISIDGLVDPEESDVLFIKDLMNRVEFD